MSEVKRAQMLVRLNSISSSLKSIEISEEAIQGEITQVVREIDEYIFQTVSELEEQAAKSVWKTFKALWLGHAQPKKL